MPDGRWVVRTEAGRTVVTDRFTWAVRAVIPADLGNRTVTPDGSAVAGSRTAAAGLEFRDLPTGQKRPTSTDILDSA